MTRLLTFVLSNNSFEGQIPCGLDSVQLVDLSHNSLSGSLPSCLNLRFVEHLRLQGNKFTGPIPKVVFNSSSLLTLDLTDNSFFGSIPDEIGALYNLRILLLRGNYFSGIIPNQLCWLNKIGIIDLSKNSLSGTIPHCFHNMSFGNIDDLVYYRYPSMSWSIGLGSTFQRLREWNWEGGNMVMWIESDDQVEVEFVTKYRSNSYSGYILNYMQQANRYNPTGTRRAIFNSCIELVLQSVDRFHFTKNLKFGQVGEFRPFSQQFEWRNSFSID